MVAIRLLNSQLAKHANKMAELEACAVLKDETGMTFDAKSECFRVLLSPSPVVVKPCPSPPQNKTAPVPAPKQKTPKRGCGCGGRTLKSRHQV